MSILFQRGINLTVFVSELCMGHSSEILYLREMCKMPASLACPAPHVFLRE